MRLSELHAHFCARIDETYRKHVSTLAEADGLFALCPVCFARNGGAVGTHSMLLWFSGRGVPDSETPGPGRWHAQGTGLEDLTLVAALSSVKLEGGCGAHFYIRNGEIVPA